MSLLLQLPPEILARIMYDVGSSYFRQSLDRLTVCKTWFDFAQPVLFSELQLSRGSLQRWMSFRNLGRGRPLIQEYMRALEIKLQGVEDWNSIKDYLRVAASNQGLITVNQWTSALNNDLIMLGGIVKGAPKLRTICIQAFTEIHPNFPDLRRRDYLVQPTLEALLTTQNLASLELDLVGTHLWADHGMRDSNSHICPVIGGLLATLKRLRLRLRSICPAIMTPPPGSTSLHLSEMVVNLSLTNESLSVTSTTHSADCGSGGAVDFTSKGDLYKSAEAMVSMMKSPKKLRLLWHTLPQAKLQALDVLTGKLMALVDGADWNDDGEYVNSKEQEDEAEFLDLPYISDE